MAEEVRLGDRCIEIHQAMIYDRGGTNRLWQLVDVASVRWTRELDNQSTADVVITGESCRDQADVLALIEPRRHELVLFRNGVRVWEGPIVEVAWFRDRATIIANDIIEYMRYTPLTKAWPNSEGGGPPLMLDRTREIITYELTTPYTMTVGTGEAIEDVVVPRWENLDPPANILPHMDIRAGDVITTSVTEAFEMTLFEHITNLARSGMEFTVIGRQFLAWDKANPLGRTRTVTENDFYGDIELYAAGSEHYSIAHVAATPAEEEVDPDDPNPPPPAPPLIVGSAGGEHEFYGVWTQIVTTESEEGSSDPTQEALNGQAGRQLVGRTPVPLEIRVPTGAGMKPSFDLTIADLVPGVEMPVLALLNLRKVSQLQRIEKVTVTEDPGNESVGITLTPAGEIEGVAP